MIDKIKEFFTKPDLDDSTKEILKQNEIEGNKLVAFAMLNLAILFVVAWILNRFDVFQLDHKTMTETTVQALLELLIPWGICKIFKGKKRWMKYLLMLELVIVLARFDSLLTVAVPVLIVLPVILSTRYFSRSFSAMIAVVSTVLFSVSSYFATGMGMGIVDLNSYYVTEETTLPAGEFIYKALTDLKYTPEYTRDYMLNNFLPRILIFSCIAIICCIIAHRGYNMVVEQAQMSGKNARIESELGLATDIQANMLPSIFPPFPERDEFDVYAMMNPAKEVGGDFYDMFMLDDKNIAVVIADVSGKGVPAALFMVIAKALIKNHAQAGLTPAEVFTKTNQMLCDGNEVGLFVTAWMGVLNVETGCLTYANAGHNPPLIRRDDGDFEYLRSRPGFVLAGMDGIRYKQFETHMSPGDKLFLYTDGVTEATNEESEMYGEDRLRDYLNVHPYDNVRDTLVGLRTDLDRFVGEAEQFDDITMLILDYYKTKDDSGIIEREFDACDDELHNVIEFVESEAEKLDCPIKASMQISVAVEEIFVNIAHYAYEGKTGKMSLAVIPEEGGMSLCFRDRGLPFDPLAKNDPDISKSAADREIGGLGIFMVKKTMDNVEYKYENGQNVLTITKKF